MGRIYDISKVVPEPLKDEFFNRYLMLSTVDECLHLILDLSWPMLVAAIVVGVVIAVFQAVTQVQEQTLSFVPKIVATFYAVLKYGPWIATSVVTYCLKMLGYIQFLNRTPG